jgi:hypothetical protein
MAGPQPFEESAMDRQMHSILGKTLGLATLLALAGGCQELNCMVTGEKFLQAPEGSPRVELEVELIVHDGFYDSLEDVDGDAREALEAEMEDIVVSLANVGLRFYPVAAHDYHSGDDRPERRLLVEVDHLGVSFDEKMVQQEGEPSRIVAHVGGATCPVNVRMEKRRKDGPELVVGRGESLGKARHSSATEEQPAAEETYAVRTDVAQHEGLRVPRQCVLDAFEDGTVDALRTIIKAVDRDLSADSPKTTPTR